MRGRYEREHTTSPEKHGDCEASAALRRRRVPLAPARGGLLAGAGAVWSQRLAPTARAPIVLATVQGGSTAASFTTRPEKPPPADGWRSQRRGTRCSRLASAANYYGLQSQSAQEIPTSRPYPTCCKACRHGLHCTIKLCAAGSHQMDVGEPHRQGRPRGMRGGVCQARDPQRRHRWPASARGNGRPGRARTRGRAVSATAMASAPAPTRRMASGSSPTARWRASMRRYLTTWSSSRARACGASSTRASRRPPACTST